MPGPPLRPEVTDDLAPDAPSGRRSSGSWRRAGGARPLLTGHPRPPRTVVLQLARAAPERRRFEPAEVRAGRRLLAASGGGTPSRATNASSATPPDGTKRVFGTRSSRAPGSHAFRSRQAKHLYACWPERLSK